MRLRQPRRGARGPARGGPASSRSARGAPPGGTTGGRANRPPHPPYRAPPMPWPAFRHLTDVELWAIVAYLKHGIKANANKAPDSQGPPDFWAGAYNVNAIGPTVLPGYP